MAVSLMLFGRLLDIRSPLHRLVGFVASPFPAPAFQGSEFWTIFFIFLDNFLVPAGSWFLLSPFA